MAMEKEEREKNTIARKLRFASHSPMFRKLAQRITNF